MQSLMRVEGMREGGLNLWIWEEVVVINPLSFQTLIFIFSFNYYLLFLFSDTSF